MSTISMRVFVTGASGYIGSVVVRELLDAGHTVVGLARSDESAEAIKADGAEVHRGGLDDLESLSSGAAAADGVIHLAYNHDFSDMNAAAATDLQAIKAMGETLKGTNKGFVIASGTLFLAGLNLGRTGTEEDVATTGLARIVSENTAIDLAKDGVRSSVVRLSPSVHGEGDHGFMAMLISIAREKGVSAYVGDGASRWPAVHRLDAAHLFRLAVESAPAGTRLHGVGDEGIPFRDIAEVIGRKLNLPVQSIEADKAVEHFGFLGALVQMDNPTSSTLTQKLLDWKATHPGLIADLEEGHYFNS